MTTFSIFKLALMVFAISAATTLLIANMLYKAFVVPKTFFSPKSKQHKLLKKRVANDDITEDIIEFLNGVANDTSAPFEAFILNDDQLQYELDKMRVSDYKKLNERLNFAIKNEDYLTAKSIQNEINTLTKNKPSANGNT